MACGSRGAVEGVEALEADGDASSADAGRLSPCGQLGGARREKWRVHADLSRARTSRSGRAEARRRRSAAGRGRAAVARPIAGCPRSRPRAPRRHQRRRYLEATRRRARAIAAHAARRGRPLGNLEPDVGAREELRRRRPAAAREVAAGVGRCGGEERILQGLLGPLVDEGAVRVGGAAAALEELRLGLGERLLDGHLVVAVRREVDDARAARLHEVHEFGRPVHRGVVEDEDGPRRRERLEVPVWRSGDESAKKMHGRGRRAGGRP